MIPMEELVEGNVYRIQSRNLVVGVWVAERKGFIGIRSKFGADYLFTEYHYDASPSYGTVTAAEPMDVALHGVELVEGWTECAVCRARVTWHGVPYDQPRPPYGEYRHDDPALDVDHAVDACERIENELLFSVLKPLHDIEYEKANAEWSKMVEDFKKTGWKL